MHTVIFSLNNSLYVKYVLLFYSKQEHFFHEGTIHGHLKETNFKTVFLKMGKWQFQERENC